MVFDGQDPSYDLLIGLLLVGIPMIIQFFYFRANKHFQDKQNIRIQRERQEKERIIKEMKEFAIKTANDVKDQKDRTHQEMMRQFAEGIKNMKDQLVQQFQLENKTTTEMINKMSEANAQLHKLNEDLNGKVNNSNEIIDVLQGQIDALENEIDTINDQVSGKPLTAKEKREKTRKRRLSQSTKEK